MYSLKNRAFAGVLALLMLLSMTGCAGTTSGEESSSSTITQEEYDALKEQNEKLQAELDELKGETDEETESDTESGSSSEAESTSTPDGSSSSSTSSQSSTPATSGSSQSSAQQSSSQSSAPASTSSQSSAQSQSGSSTPAPQKTTSSSGKGPLAKYTVNVSDSSTSAVKVVGETLNGKSAYYFYSSSGKLLGNIPIEYLTTIIRENGLSYAEADEQKAWFVENFNIYRGLDSGSSSGSSSSGSSSSSNQFDAEEFCKEVIRLTNLEREKAGQEPLSEDSTTMEYAQIRAEEIADSYSHIRPSNKPSSMDGLEFIENIAYGQKSPEEVVNDWMNSDGHRATLMGDYSDYGNRMGVGCYKSGGTIYWTQEFVLWDANA